MSTTIEQPTTFLSPQINESESELIIKPCILAPDVNKLIQSKEFNKAVEILQSYATNEINTNIIEKIKCHSNLSYIYFLQKNYKAAKDIVYKMLEQLTETPELYTTEEPDTYFLLYGRLYYRLAKSYEGLQLYEDMCDAYNKMHSILPDTAKDKKFRHMQDYYNKDVLFMRQWIIENGGIINSLDIEYYDVDYRGMALTESVKPSNLLIQVPIKCIISLEESKLSNPYNVHLLRRKAKIATSHTFSALELLHIRHTNGFHMPYIRCLPKYYDNVPINFRIKDIEYLSGSYAIIKIVQKIASLLVEYEEIIQHFDTSKGDPEFPFTFMDFVWSRTAIITRVYAADYKNKKDTFSVPFADMANHDIKPNTVWTYDPKVNAFTVKSEHYLGAGQQIFETYGHKCNYRYFVNYGFTTDNNKDEECCLIFNPFQKLAFFDIYLKLKQHSNKDDIICNVVANNKSTYVTNALFAEQTIFQVGFIYNESVKNMFLFNRYRLDHPQVDYNPNYKLTKEDIEKYQNPISIETEIAIYEHIRIIVHQMLKDFTSTVEEDIALIKNNNTFNMHNMLVMRKEEKLMLMYWDMLCQYMGETLIARQMGDKKSFKKLAKKMSRYSNFQTFNPYLLKLEKLF